MLELVNFLDVPLSQRIKTRDWRNSEQVAKYFQIKYISEDVHQKWLKRLTENPPQTIAFLIKLDDQYLGVTYFHSINYEKRECDWGIYIYDINHRGKRIGYNSLSKCIDFAKDTLKMSTIFLEVLESNETAKKLYERLDFKLLSTDNNILRYKRNL